MLHDVRALFQQVRAMAARWAQCARLIMAATAVAACLLTTISAATTAGESMLRQLQEAVPHQLNPDLLQQVCVSIYTFSWPSWAVPIVVGLRACKWLGTEFHTARNHTSVRKRREKAVRSRYHWLDTASMRDSVWLHPHSMQAGGTMQCSAATCRRPWLRWTRMCWRT